MEKSVEEIGLELKEHSVTNTGSMRDATAALLQASGDVLALQFPLDIAAGKLVAIAADGLAMTVGQRDAAAYLRTLADQIDGDARGGARS